MFIMAGLTIVFTWAALKAKAEKVLECLFIVWTEGRRFICKQEFTSRLGIVRIKEMPGY